jgi:hypothetical protein
MLPGSKSISRTSRSTAGVICCLIMAVRSVVHGLPESFIQPPLALRGGSAAADLLQAERMAAGVPGRQMAFHQLTRFFRIRSFDGAPAGLDYLEELRGLPGQPSQPQLGGGPVLAACLSAHRTMINGSALCAALAVTERD